MTLKLNFTEKRHLNNLYLCVLVKGLNLQGEKCYCYFGLFTDTVDQMLDDVAHKKPFNPKDYKAIVLARNTGDPTPEIRQFMQMKFSFAEDEVILEVSEPMGRGERFKSE